VQGKAHVRQRFGWNARESGWFDRRRFGGVVGLDPRALDLRDVAEIGQASRGFEAGDETGNSAP
jgi:hypothetical protein